MNTVYVIFLILVISLTVLYYYKRADAYEAQRLVRKKNDILSAQILAKTNAIQYDLCKANIGILIDKFISIEKVLRPALEQNVKFSKSQFNRIF